MPRKDFCNWLKAVLFITYTAWIKKPREERLKDYEKYQKGAK